MRAAARLYPPRFHRRFPPIAFGHPNGFHALAVVESQQIANRAVHGDEFFLDARPTERNSLEPKLRRNSKGRVEISSADSTRGRRGRQIIAGHGRGAGQALDRPIALASVVLAGQWFDFVMAFGSWHSAGAAAPVDDCKEIAECVESPPNRRRRHLASK